MSKLQALRAGISQDRILKFAGVFDALSARIAEESGLDGVWISGYGVAAATFAKPDIGLTTLTEMADRARNICRAVGIPVVADGEVGYGNALNVARTVEEFHQAGVVGMQLGDEANETCPYLGLPTQILSEEEAVLKIKAAKAAAGDNDFMVFSAPQQGIDRAVRYAEAGADAVLFPWENLVGGSPDKDTRDAFQHLHRNGAIPVAVTAPFLPPVDARELYDLGFRIMVLAVENLYAAAKAQLDLWKAFMETGTTAGLDHIMITRQEEFMPLVREEEVRRVAREFLPDSFEEIDKRKRFVVGS